ncbi:MAG: hypothetical protein AAGP08_05835 [Pseudomonadota bacterium]
MPTIAEIVTFPLIAGTDPGAFVTAARATDPVVQAQPGFVARHLSQGPDGRWTDYVLWADMEPAQNASNAVMQSSVFARFAEMIDPEGMVLRHEEIQAVFE